MILDFTLSNIIRIVLFIIAALFLILALRALMVGLNSRRMERKEFYNVGRLEARRKLFRNVFATIMLILVALIVATAGIFIPERWFEPAAIATNSLADPAVSNEQSAVAEPVQESTGNTPAPPSSDSTEGAASSETPLPPTETSVPTDTPSPTPQIVFVNSPVVGLYLRTAPGGEIVLLLEDQTPLTVIGEVQTLDDTEWVNVSGFDGEIGWVAAGYVTDSPPPTETPEPTATQ